MVNPGAETTVFCTIGGTALAVAQAGGGFNPLQVALSAALGAIVSFVVTAALQRWFKQKP